MRPITKLRLTAAFLVAATLGIGCNPLTGTYFMLFGIDDKALRVRQKRTARSWLDFARLA